MPKMGVDPEKVKAAKPHPAGWYKLKLVAFKPKKAAKDANSVNYNGQFEIVNNMPDLEKRVYTTMSDKMPKHINDIVHGLGFALEKDGSIPGDWEPDPKDPNNIEKYQYKGPLLGRTLEAELSVTTYNGNERNEMRQVRCAVKDCQVQYPDIKHLTNMIGKQ
jgi:hypothetical protein